MAYDNETNRYLIKKSSFFRNTTFSAKKCAPMQRFINQMSKNGMHLERISTFKCIFSEDASIRYIYELCGEGGATLYTGSDEWEHFLTYKNVMFFRKSVPADAVHVERKFKKDQLGLERNWLNARLSEGLYLLGKVENEYIFARSKAYETYEYQIKKPEKTKKKDQVDPADTLKDISGLKFVTAAIDGSCYYFLKDAHIKNRFVETRGRRLSDQLLAATVSILALIAFIALSALTVFGAIRNSKPFILLGAAGLVIALITFIVYFRKTQKIAEARRIWKAEEKARLEAERRAAEEQPQTEAPQTPDATNNNTVVMNTVVVNKYGDEGGNGRRGGQVYDTGFDSMGQIFDPADNPQLDPNLNPAIAASKDPIRMAQALINGTDPSSRGSADSRDTIYDGAFSTDRGDTIYVDPEVEHPERRGAAYGDEYDEDEYDDEDYGDGDDSERPTLLYLLYGAATAIGIALAVLGIYMLVSFFSGGNGLFIAIAIVSLIFSPFLIRFGILNLRALMNGEYYDDEEEEDDDDYEDYED